MLRSAIPSALFLVTALAVGSAQEDRPPDLQNDFDLANSLDNTNLFVEEEREVHLDVEAESKQDHDPIGKEVYVYQLQHMQSAALAKLIKRLFPESDLIVEAQEPTNQVLVRCDPVMRDKISELIERIDVPATLEPQPEAKELESEERVLFGEATPAGPIRAPLPPVGPVTWTPWPHPPGEDVLIRVGQTEHEMAIIAEQIRGFRQTSNPDEQALADLERQLTDRVQVAFDARQQLHRAELGVLRQQLISIERRIAARDRVKDQLVRQRVKDLISGRTNMAFEAPAPRGGLDVLLPPSAAPIVKLELIAKRRAAELKLRSALLNHEAARAMLEQVEKRRQLDEGGASPPDSSPELIQARLQAEQAELQVQRAEGVLELLQAVEN